MLTILNSNFEEWRKANKTEDTSKFPFNLKKMSVSGALFDMVKFNDVSKNVISVMTAKQVYKLVTDWAMDYNEVLYALFVDDKEKATAILNIDRENPKPRKDIACWEEVENYVSFFYNELYDADYTLPEHIKREDAIEILTKYKEVYSPDDSKEDWFNKIKELCTACGYTPNVKEYKQNPDAFKGHVGDVSTIIRIAITSRTNTPDLYYIMQILGKDEVMRRIDNMIEG